MWEHVANGQRIRACIIIGKVVAFDVGVLYCLLLFWFLYIMHLWNKDQEFFTCSIMYFHYCSVADEPATVATAQQSRKLSTVPIAILWSYDVC